MIHCSLYYVLVATSFFKLHELTNKPQALMKCLLDKVTSLRPRHKSWEQTMVGRKINNVCMGKGKYLVSYLSNPHKTILVTEKRCCVSNYSNCLIVNVLLFSKCLFSSPCHFLYVESVTVYTEVMAHAIQLCNPSFPKWR